MKTSETLGEIAGAMAAMQSELVDAKKDQQGYSYRYADLAGILQIARPLASKNGIAIIQEAATEADMIAVTTRLIHKSGEWLEFNQLHMAVEPKKGLSQAQCVGSVVTYARRYALAAAIGITQDDDDAAAGEKPTTKQTSRAPQQSQPAPKQTAKPANASSSPPASQPGNGASEGMLRLLRARAESKGITDEQVIAKAGVESLEQITGDLFNQLQTWIREQ